MGTESSPEKIKLTHGARHSPTSVAYRRSRLKDALALLETAQDLFETKRSRIDADEAAIVREEIDACYSRACVYTETAEFDKSLFFFQRGWDLSEGHDDGISTPWPYAEMHYALCGGMANSLNGLGRDAESEPKYQDCLELNKNFDVWPIYEINMRRCQWMRGKLDEAASGLEDFIRRRTAARGEDDPEGFLFV